MASSEVLREIRESNSRVASPDSSNLHVGGESNGLFMHLSQPYVYEPMMWYKAALDYDASDMTGNVREWSLPGEPRSVLP